MLTGLPLDGLLQQALFTLSDGVAIIDPAYHVIYINQSGQEIIRHHLGMLIHPGDNLLQAIREDRREHSEAQVRAAFEGRTVQHQAKYDCAESDAWFEFHFYPLLQEDGSIPYICIRGRNITETILLQKRLESERIAQRNAILKATLDAQEKQRSEIGRELHDNVNQVLTTVKLYNEICLSEPEPNRNMLLRSVQQINYCIETLRNLSKSLAAPTQDEMGIKESIRELAGSVDATRKIGVRFYSYGVREELVSAELQTTIYRIAQEQLTNVLKYAQADSVEVILVGTASTIALSIQDNGAGFVFLERRNGVGITNMISRTEAFGGEIEFITSPGEGCRLMVEFPLTGS